MRAGESIPSEPLASGSDCAILLCRRRPHIARALLGVEGAHARLRALRAADLRRAAIVHLTHLPEAASGESGLVRIWVHVAVPALAVSR